MRPFEYTPEELIGKTDGAVRELRVHSVELHEWVGYEWIHMYVANICGDETLGYFVEIEHTVSPRRDAIEPDTLKMILADTDPSHVSHDHIAFLGMFETVAEAQTAADAWVPAKGGHEGFEY